MKRLKTRCTGTRVKLAAVLKEAAPDALDGLPSWATGAVAASSERGDCPEEVLPEEEGSPRDEEKAVAKFGAAGSLPRELRQRVFELEGQVSELEGKLARADDSPLAVEGRDGGGGGGMGACSSSDRGEQ